MNENNTTNNLDPFGGVFPVTGDSMSSPPQTQSDIFQPTQADTSQGIFQQTQPQVDVVQQAQGDMPQTGQADTSQGIFQQADASQGIFQTSQADTSQGIFQQADASQNIFQQAQPQQPQFSNVQQSYQPSISLQTGVVQNGFGQNMQSQQQNEQTLSPKEQKKLQKQKDAEEKKRLAEEKKLQKKKEAEEKKKFAEEKKLQKKKEAEEKKNALQNQAKQKAEEGGGLFGFLKKKKEEPTQPQQQQVQNPNQPQLYTQEQLVQMINQGMITQEQASAQWQWQLQYQASLGVSPTMTEQQPNVATEPTVTEQQPNVATQPTMVESQPTMTEPQPTVATEPTDTDNNIVSTAVKEFEELEQRFTTEPTQEQDMFGGDMFSNSEDMFGSDNDMFASDDMFAPTSEQPTSGVSLAKPTQQSMSNMQEAQPTQQDMMTTQNVQPTMQEVQPVMQEAQPIQQNIPQDMSGMQPQFMQQGVPNMQPAMQSVEQVTQETKKGGLFGFLNKKEPKANKDQLVPESVNGEKKSSKKTLMLIGGVVIGFIVLIFAMKIIKGLTSGNGSSSNKNDNFYSLFEEAMSINQGSFEYTLQVSSKDHDATEEATPTETEEMSVDELNNTQNNVEDSSEETTETEESTGEQEVTEISEQNNEAEDENSEKTLSAKTSEWTDKSTDVREYWKNPKYTFKISGVTASGDSCKFDITLATNDTNDVFTSVIITDGKQYINLGKMKTWLSASNDKYLISIADKMPSTKEWVTADSNSLQFVSNYVDSEDEIADATTGNFLYEFDKWLTMMRTISSSLNSITNGAGLSSNNNDKLLNLDSSSINMNGVVLSLVSNPKSIYQSFLSNLQVYQPDENHQRQLTKNEIDNFVDSFTPAIVGLSSQGDSMPFQVSGSLSRFNEGNAVNRIEGSLQIGYTYNNTDYTIVLTIKHDGVTEEVSAPSDAEIVSIDEIDNKLTIDETFDSVIEYLNFTDIKYCNSFMLNNDKVIDKSLEAFADYINSLNIIDYKLNINNVKQFIEKYRDSSVFDESDTSSIAISKLVNEYLVSMRNIDEVIKGNVTSEEENVDKSQERYPQIKKKLGDLSFKVQVDKNLSTSKVLVIKGSVKNSSIDKIKLSLNDFALVKLDSSSVSSNDMDLLSRAGVSADDIKSTVTINPRDSSNFTLYFPTDASQGQSSLVFRSDEIGYVANY